MTFKEWLKYGIYKKLWSLVIGRPFTYALRDIWHKYEWFPQMWWAFTGIGFEALREALGWPFWTHLIWIGLYTYGYIQGHLKWGKDYIPGQQGD